MPDATPTSPAAPVTPPPAAAAPAAGTPAASTTPTPPAPAADASGSTTPPAASTPAAQDTTPTDGGNKDASASGTADASAWKPTLPEGVTLDDATLSALREATTGLDDKGRQALVDMHLGVLEQHEKAAAQHMEQAKAEWKQQLASDAELGGAKQQATLENVKAAMARFATPAFTAFVEETGLGDHPEFVRVMARAGALLREDSIAGTATPGSTSPGAAPEELLFPTMFKKES